ncbi:hypothetical protein NON20_09795 [Synechocystis sp. B12]|nr:hypothetical protein NON20_09795 [Synechocystis sp. B12]
MGTQNRFEVEGMGIGEGKGAELTVLGEGHSPPLTKTAMRSKETSLCLTEAKKPPKNAKKSLTKAR